MSVTAGLGRGEYLLLFPALIAWRAREPRHYVGKTRLEIVVITDVFSINNRLCRREQEVLSRSYEWAPEFNDRKEGIPKGDSSAD